jgi:putative hydroxymethylpyrimidine transport system ATP-binding protein
MPAKGTVSVARVPAPGFRIDLPQGLSLGGEAVLGACAVDAPAGRITALLGPSGSGKSTLMRLAAGLLALPPGGALRTTDGARLAGRIAWMAQQDLLVPWRDALGNVTIGAHLRGAKPDVGRARALLAEVGLSPADAAKSPAQLSGGMRQRVALARTLMEDRPVVLMDEPFSAVDAPTRHRLQDLAARLLAGRTVLLVTHDPLEALRLADRILVLSGRPATPAEVAVPQGTPPRTARDGALLAAQGALLERLAEVA